MALTRSVSQILAIVFLPDENMNRNYRKEPEHERKKYSPGSLNHQLLPAPFSDRKTDPHSGNKKQKRNPPHIKHGHRYPYGFQRFIALNKSNEHPPGLKGNGNVVNKQQANCDYSQPIDIVSSGIF